jgi:hypothetical protein
VDQFTDVPQFVGELPCIEAERSFDEGPSWAAGTMEAPATLTIKIAEAVATEAEFIVAVRLSEAELS